MQLVDHAYNLILKAISNIYDVIPFYLVLNKRDTDIKMNYENGVISENGIKIR